VKDTNYFRNEIRPQMDASELKYLGEVAPDWRNMLLSHSDALILPVHSEGFSDLFVIEANACGTPVVSLGQGTVSEIIIENTNGFIANDVEEAIKAINKIHGISYQCPARRVGLFSVGRASCPSSNRQARRLSHHASCSRRLPL
jgi:glycosyltransferase involved in cell wall biosynthesis